MTNPLRKLTNRMKEGVSSDFAESVQLSSHDEIHQLTLYFNSFIYRIEQYNKSLQAEIAERRQVEEALRESEERYRRLADATHEAIAISKNGKVIEVSKQIEEIYGYTIKQLYGEEQYTNNLEKNILTCLDGETVHAQNSTEPEDQY